MTIPTAASKYTSAPMRPAEPQTSAYRDCRYAAMVPSETSVSIVVAPWRRLTHAARWNGQPAHTTTGVARTSETHCQPGK